MLLTLNLRECWLGPKYGGKVETVDGQKIRPLQFEVDSFALASRELNALLGQPNAWTRLYSTLDDGSIVPFLTGFKTLELEQPIKHAFVRVQYGRNFEHEMAFSGCKLRKLKLVLCEGGDTALSCEVKTKPTLDNTLAELFEYFDEKVRAELVFQPPNAQQDLPLSTAGVGELPEDPRRAAAQTAAAKAGKRKPRAKRSNIAANTVN